MTKVAFHPLRLLMLVPIVFLGTKFEDELISVLFQVSLGFITGLFFPPFESVKEN
jgi:hypothetical protein